MLSKEPASISKITEFIKDFCLDDLPAQAVKITNYVVLDSLGTGLAGSNLRASEITRQIIKSFPMGPLEARLWGYRERTSCIWATWGNSIAASCLDADDGHRGALGHPGAVIIPAAVALAERTGACGRELLESIVVGYEIGLRAGMFFNRDTRTAYYGTGTWGAIGASAAAARLLGLGPKACSSALGLAEIKAPLALIMNWIRLRRSPEVKESAGWGALTGLMAALLAEKGLQGVFSLPEQPGGEVLTNGLGRDFEITRIYFKMHSACRWTHPAIDGIIQALREYEFKPEEIRQITVATHHKAANLDNPKPSSAEEAQYSIPYMVAAAMIHGGVGPAQMSRSALNDERILALASKVIVQYDPELDKRFPKTNEARIIVSTTLGNRIIVQPTHSTRGDWQDPFSPRELEDKFRVYAATVLPADKIEEIIDLVIKLGKLDKVEELTRMLVPDFCT